MRCANLPKFPRVCQAALFSGLSFFFLETAPAHAQMNPCDLNHDGIVNNADVQAAKQMARGILQCTADILGPGECNSQVVRRVQTASSNGVCVTGNPTPPSLSSTSASPTILTGGQAGTGSVAINGPAGSGGVVVSLSSSTAGIQIPSSVTIVPGATSATFPITGNTVSSVTVSIMTAVYSGVWATSNVTVNPGTLIPLTSFSVSPGLLISGQAATGTIGLSGPAPAGGASVAISSNNGAVSVPATVVVPQGSTSATFGLTAGMVAASIQVQLNAAYAGANFPAVVTVDPPAVNLSWIPSTSPGVAGYNVYRGTVSGGPYTQVNPAIVPGTTYLDSGVQPASTYYYVTTSLNTSNEQSVYSNQAQVFIP